MAEIVRAGISSVDEGQTEAAQALGMTRSADCCGASSCRRRCGSSSRPPATSSSTCSRPASLAYDDPVPRAAHVGVRRSTPATCRSSSCCSPSRSGTCCSPASSASGSTTWSAASTAGPAGAARPTPWQRVRDQPARKATAVTDDLVTADGAWPRTFTRAFGRLEVLKGIDLEVRPRRGAVPARAVRLGQVHVPALHQPPRAGRRRPAIGRRRARRLPASGAASSTSSRRTRPRARAPRSAWSSSASTSSRT